MYFVYKKKSDVGEIQWMRENVKEGEVVFDIGANIGFYSLLLSNQVGSEGKVYSFEPDPLNYKRLRNSISSNFNTMCFNKAVGENKGSISLFKSKFLNVDHRTYKPDTYNEEIRVDLISLDDFCFEHEIEKIDFIKIDIQGYEMSAIKGAKIQLERNKRVKILSEFWPYGLKKAGSSALEYFNYLDQLGFDVFKINGLNLESLNQKIVEEMIDLPENEYFNIYAKRSV